MYFVYLKETASFFCSLFFFRQMSFSLEEVLGNAPRSLRGCAICLSRGMQAYGEAARLRQPDCILLLFLKEERENSQGDCIVV